MGKSNDLGLWGERMAAKLMLEKGYSFIAHSYHSRWGEIDLIMENRDYLIFCEVKLRKTDRYGTPGACVTPAKQEKLRKTALKYLQEHPTEKQPRFDVVELYAPNGLESEHVWVRQIENAF